MTPRIEDGSDGQRTILHLSGRIHAEHVDELMAQIRRSRSAVALDLTDVTLVDAVAVRFLIAREAEGIDLLNCAPYIRAWMDGERRRGG